MVVHRGLRFVAAALFNADRGSPERSAGRSSIGDRPARLITLDRL